MSKKIKITESQLKMIFERKHSYSHQENEEVFDEFDQLEDDDKEKRIEINRYEIPKKGGYSND